MRPCFPPSERILSSPDQEVLREITPIELVNLLIEIVATPGTEYNPNLGDELLRSLRLDGDEPDGWTLLERFAGRQGNPLDPLKLDLFRQNVKLLPTLRRIDQIIGNVSESPDTLSRDGWEALEALAQIVDRQLVREHNLCPHAHAIAMTIMQNKPELLSDEAQELLSPTDDLLSGIVQEVIRRRDNSVERETGSVLAVPIDKENVLYIQGLDNNDLPVLLEVIDESSETLNLMFGRNSGSRRWAEVRSGVYLLALVSSIGLGCEYQNPIWVLPAATSCYSLLRSRRKAKEHEIMEMGITEVVNLLLQVSMAILKKEYKFVPQDQYEEIS